MISSLLCQKLTTVMEILKRHIIVVVVLSLYPTLSGLILKLLFSGYNPVLRAEVYAIVERPTQGEIRRKLKDNGSGLFFLS